MRTIDLLLPIVSLLFLSVLLSQRIRVNLLWRAGVTPLASIIGSGFLVATPMLGVIVGSMAPWAMAAIVAFAYLIGSVIRFNIRYAEPREKSGTASAGQVVVEHLSNLGLLGAYVISVAFYLRLMSAFVLRGLGVFTEVNANMLTTAVLLFIGLIGWRRGLQTLERLEKYSVSVKLAIIGAFLLALGLHDASAGIWNSAPQNQERPVFETLRMLAGMLLVVQGFETSRYLGEEYSTRVRVRSMQFAQALSALIYIVFAFLMLPLLPYLSADQLNETSIIDLSRQVSVVLPLMLICAAAMSQFSAAVADTLGGGGLISEESRTRFLPGSGYLIMSVCSIALVWTTSVFEIISYASRAFAFYYFTQTLIAFLVAKDLPGGVKKGFRLLGFGLLSSVLAWVMFYAIPIE